MPEKVRIIVRSGTKAQLDTITLPQYSIGYTYDTEELYIGTSSGNKLVGGAIMNTIANRPPAGVPKRFFFATDEEKLYIDDGTAWHVVSITQLADMQGTLDDIADGVNYKRIAASEVTSAGEVMRLNDGTNVVSAADIQNHFDNSAIHTPLNDASNDNTHLWSAARIIEFVNSKTAGNDRRDAVLDKDLTQPPASPSQGDRYIVAPGATGDWAGHDNDIAEWNGSSWDFYTPEVGWITYVIDEEVDYQFNSSNQWVGSPSIIDHNSTTNKQGGQTGEYYHHTYDEWMRNRTPASDSDDGYMTAVDHQKLPTVNQKAALAGTDGTPSDLNRYVTNSDPRLTDARTPVAHASTHQHGGSDEIATAIPGAYAIPKANSAGNLNDWITVIDGGTFI